MIVNNTGYIKLDKVLEMFNNNESFSIYHTKKKTLILVKKATEQHIDLYKVKEDRLPWKITEGKKITSGTRIFNSNTDNIKTINIGNQIMSYEEIDYAMLMGIKK